MAVIQLALLLILATVSKAEHLRDTNTSFVGNPKRVDVPVSKNSDFENNVMNRDWMEGYYTNTGSYFRAYMAVFDDVFTSKYKYICQDKSGHIITNGKLWIGFGRPARQIAFAEEYLKRGKAKKANNKPLIQSFLVDAETVIEISRRAVEERWSSRGLDINVDQNDPNQFGIDPVSAERLRQNALSGSMVTYYLEKSKEHASWGLVQDYTVLKERVKNLNLKFLFPNKKGEFEGEDLFPIKQDVLSLNPKFNPEEAEKQSAAYKGYLVKRQVLRDLIEEIKFFYKHGGQPYRELKADFFKNVVPLISQTFKQGADVTEQELDKIEQSIIINIKNGKPSQGADVCLWGRFSHSVDQIEAFSTYSGTEVRIGPNDDVIKEWDIFKNYQSFSVQNAKGLMPKDLMQLAQDSTNILIRMSYNTKVEPDRVCQFIKLNFMGQRVDRLQLVSPIKDASKLMIYAKLVSDCVEGNGVIETYQDKPLKATLVEIYGQDKHEYRFYPDAQVGWSVKDKGTMILILKGVVLNLRIKGTIRNFQDILHVDNPTDEFNILKQRLKDMIETKGSGLTIVPQKYIKW